MTQDDDKSNCCPSAAQGREADPNSTVAAVPWAQEPASARRVARIPGGPSFIGTAKPILAIDGEGVIKKGRVNAFDLDITAVTNQRFAGFVEATGYRTEAERLGDSFVFRGFLETPPEGSMPVGGVPWWLMVPGACWKAPLGPGSEAVVEADHPVVHVTWNDANAFAHWAGGRLPTEMEWEHAARGGQGDVAFPWGDQEPDEQGFFPCNIWQGRFPDDNRELDGHFGTAPAQSFEPNGYGLFNMVGNTWEWTRQPFTPRSQTRQAKAAHAGKKGFKVVKGGSFLCHASYCFRYRIPARTATSPDSSLSHQSFRVAYDI